VVLTKIDKVPKAKRKLVANEVRRDLRLARDPLMCSATTTDGLADVWRFLVHTVSNARTEAP
jgi:GTP-binding protein EngB required for normal cell division